MIKLGNVCVSTIAAVFFAGACAPATTTTTTTTAAQGLEEDRANAIRTALSVRGIESTLKQVDDLHYDILVDHKNEFHARYTIQDAELLERPSWYGQPSPSTRALRETASAIEEQLRTKHGVVAAHVVILKPAPPTPEDAQLESKRRPWAHVGVVYQPIDERGTAAFHVDHTKRLVADAAGVEERDVLVQMKRERPL